MIGTFGPLWLSADVSDVSTGFFDSIQFETVGAGGTAFLLAAFVLSLLRGWLVPRRILLDRDKQLADERAGHQTELDRISVAHEKELLQLAKRTDELVDDRNQWRSVAHLKDEAHRELARSVDQMTDAMRSINAAFVAFPEGVRRAQAATGGDQNA